ncbi:S8 family serine peptidase [Streptococcus uberis]|uniref:S8 family serine peptidase n=1 Tax=Streptococcus uberis TaxID=1349 RepID=UPI0027DC7D1F|nr:S8 family serine peptidase [Streptococcus uberis]MCK1195073.1 S8 family serine peptidase [Streptococcus uberis]
MRYKKMTRSSNSRIVLQSTLIMIFASSCVNHFKGTIHADEKVINGSEASIQVDHTLNTASENRQIPEEKVTEEATNDQPELLEKQAAFLHEGREKNTENLPLDGRGSLIASIDSGVDIKHEAFANNDDNHDFHKETEVSEGSTSKIPFVYDFLSGDTSVRDDEEEHGMHIAGILVGDSKKGFKGMAPKAQLIAYRTWSKNNSEGYQEANQFFAMKDAIKRGADVISLSIGEIGSGQNDDIWAKVLEEAKKKNVVVVAAMGNYGTSATSNTFDQVVDETFPQTDSSTLLSVSANPEVIGVGSIFEKEMYLPTLKIDTLEVPYENINWQNYYLFKQEKQERISFNEMLITLNQSKEEGSLKDKVVIIERQAENIFPQLKEVMKKGAKGVILINQSGPTTYGNYETVPELRNTLLDDEDGDFKKTWAVSISANDGKALKDYLQKQDKKKSYSLVFNTKPQLKHVFKYPGVSGFSTWGPGLDLTLKPDIVALGENIYSTGNDNSYFISSGTSMSAPKVAGASAMFLPVTKKWQKKWEKQNVSMSIPQLTKLLFQNTADILYDHSVPNGKPILPYSPRRQGAGALNVKKAAQTNVFVTSADNKGAILLKDFKESRKEFDIVIRNFSDQVRRFKIEPGSVLGKILYSKDRKNYDKNETIQTVHSRVIKDSAIESPLYVQIAPNSSMILPLKLNVGKAVENEFVEGFIKLRSLEKDQPDLNIPFMGFYGDWNSENILDPVAWQEGSKTRLTGIVHPYGLGEDKFDIVPWGVDYEKWKQDPKALDADQRFYVMQSQGGIANHAKMRLRLIFMRHAKDYRVDILNSQKDKVLKTLKTGHHAPKYMESALLEHGDQYQMQFADFDPDLEWDGSVYNPKTNTDDPLPDGNYFIRVSSRISKNRPYQEHIIPFAIDNQKPKVKIEEKTALQVVFHVDDAHLQGIRLVKDNKIIQTLETDTQGRFRLNLADFQGKGFELEAIDFAENKTIIDLDSLKEKEVGYLFGASSSYNKSRYRSPRSVAHKNAEDILHENSEESEEIASALTFEDGSDFHDGKKTNAYSEINKSNDNSVHLKDNTYYRDYYIHLKEGQRLLVTTTNAFHNSKQGNDITAPTWQANYTYDPSTNQGQYYRKIAIPIYQGSNTINVKAFYKDKLIFNKGYAVKLDTEVPQLTFDNPNISFTSDKWQNLSDDEYDDDNIVGTITIPNNTLRLSGKIRDGLDGWRMFINGDMVDSDIKLGEYDDIFQQNRRQWKYEKQVENDDYVLIKLSDHVKNSRSYLFKVKIDPTVSEYHFTNKNDIIDDDKTLLTLNTLTDSSLGYANKLLNMPKDLIKSTDDLFKAMTMLFKKESFFLYPLKNDLNTNGISMMTSLVQFQAKDVKENIPLEWEIKTKASDSRQVLYQNLKNEKERLDQVSTNPLAHQLPLENSNQENGQDAILTSTKVLPMSKSSIFRDSLRETSLPETRDSSSMANWSLAFFLSAVICFFKGRRKRLNKL